MEKHDGSEAIKYGNFVQRNQFDSRIRKNEIFGGKHVPKQRNPQGADGASGGSGGTAAFRLPR